MPKPERKNNSRVEPAFHAAQVRHDSAGTLNYRTLAD